jgi:hypothetical protein
MMKTQLKKTLIVVAFFAAVAIGWVIGGYATSLVAASISFVAFDQGIITNFFTIKGDRLVFSVSALSGDDPDHVVLEYRDESSKVVGSDIVYLHKNKEGVMILETTIKNFAEPVSVYVKKP